jgi:hypothetical protein
LDRHGWLSVNLMATLADEPGEQQALLKELGLEHQAGAFKEAIAQSVPVAQRKRRRMVLEVWVRKEATLEKREVDALVGSGTAGGGGFAAQSAWE